MIKREVPTPEEYDIQPSEIDKPGTVSPAYKVSPDKLEKIEKEN